MSDVTFERLESGGTKAWLRMGIALPVGAGVAFGLFVIMTILIATGEAAIQEEVTGTSIDFIRVRRDESSQSMDRNLPDRMPPPAAPPPPPMQQSASLRPDAGGIGIPVPQMNTDTQLGGLNLSAPTDGDIMPLVRVNPQYPPRAASQGIEGWVLFELTIGSEGNVVDAIVIDSENGRMFERNARRAIMRWRYRPKIEDGVAVPRYGVRQIITFVMADE